MRLQGVTAQEHRFETIVRLHQSGKTQVEIAALVQCSQCWVSKVLKRYREEGEKGLSVKGFAPGKPAALNSSDLAQLREYLLSGAESFGFATDNWSQNRIKQLIEQQFGVSFHASHISRLMKKIGFSLQKPQGYSYKKEEAAVEQWIEQTLPEIKKGQG